MSIPAVGYIIPFPSFTTSLIAGWSTSVAGDFSNYLCHLFTLIFHRLTHFALYTHKNAVYFAPYSCRPPLLQNVRTTLLIVEYK